MDYLFIALGFLATLVATLGKTKDSTKTGIEALLPLGWVALAISAAMVTLTTYKTYRTNVALAEAAVSAASLESIARSALVGSLKSSLDGVNILYRECSTGTNFPSIATLKGELFLKCASNLDANRPPSDLNYIDPKNQRQTIADVVARVSIAGRERLWRDIINYKSAINGQLWARLSAYHDHRAFPAFELIGASKSFPNKPHIILEKESPTLAAYLELIQEALEIEAELSKS